MDSTFPFSLSHRPAILGLLYVQISRPINPHSPPPFALKWCYFRIVVIWKGSLLFQRLSGTRFVWSHSIKPLHMFCFFYTSLIAMCAQHLLPCSFFYCPVQSISIAAEWSQQWLAHTFAKRLTQSEESKKDTETQTFGTWQSNSTSIISSSLQRGVFSHRHLHKEHCEQCTVLTLCTATITIYARSIFLSVYSTSTISRLLLLFSRKSVTIPVCDNLSRSRSSQPLMSCKPWKDIFTLHAFLRNYSGVHQ